MRSLSERVGAYSAKAATGANIRNCTIRTNYGYFWGAGVATISITWAAAVFILPKTIRGEVEME